MYSRSDLAGVDPTAIYDADNVVPIVASIIDDDDDSDVPLEDSPPPAQPTSPVLAFSPTGQPVVIMPPAPPPSTSPLIVFNPLDYEQPVLIAPPTPAASSPIVSISPIEQPVLIAPPTPTPVTMSSPTLAPTPPALPYDNAPFADVTAPPPGYRAIAWENQSVTLDQPTDIAYGANGKFLYAAGVKGAVTFDNATFGDPNVGTLKAGFVKSSSSLWPWLLGGVVGVALLRRRNRNRARARSR